MLCGWIDGYRLERIRLCLLLILRWWPQRRHIAAVAWQRRSWNVWLMRFRILIWVLSPFSVAYYERLGWELWRGSLFLRTDSGLIRTPRDGGVMILRLPRTPNLDVNATLSVKRREGELWLWSKCRQTPPSNKRLYLTVGLKILCFFGKII